MTNSNQNL